MSVETRTAPVQRSPTILPTVLDRELVLDVLRGFAVLGIFLANVWAFAGPVMVDIYVGGPSESPSERMILAATDAFVTGKFRSTLAILFGFGLWLQYEKRKGVLNAWPGGYFKRTLFLLLIGVIHGVFLFWGDILALYAGVSLIGAILVTAAPVVQYRFIWGGMILSGVLGMLLAAVFMAVSEKDLASMAPLERSSLVATYGSGTVFEQIQMNLNLFGMSLKQGLFSIAMIAPLFLVGFWMARERVLTDPTWHNRAFRGVVILAIIIGIPTNFLALAFWRSGVPYSYTLMIEMLFAPFLAVGYMAYVAALVKHGVLSRLLKLLAKVGRVALSVYLLQSFLGCLIFYSWGFALYDRLAANDIVLVVLGVSACCIAFASLWLRWFAMGPVEWAWRSAVEGRRVPLTQNEAVEARRAKEAAAAAPVKFEI